jgi:hypothetical protein
VNEHGWLALVEETASWTDYLYGRLMNGMGELKHYAGARKTLDTHNRRAGWPVFAYDDRQLFEGVAGVGPDFQRDPRAIVVNLTLRDVPKQRIWKDQVD